MYRSPPAPQTTEATKGKGRGTTAPGRRQPAARAKPGLRSPRGATSALFLTGEQHILSAKFSETLKGNKQEEKNSLEGISVSS